MPAGLQCWDENGNPAVDINEYQLRFVQSGSILLPSRQVMNTIAISGVGPSTHTVFKTGGPQFGQAVHMCVVNGGIRIYTWLQFGIFGDYTYSYDLYRYA